MNESKYDCMWCTKPGCDGTHEFELDVTSDTIEKAVREERDRIVSFLTRAASRFAEFAGGPARTNADPFYAEALIEAANQIARGEYRK
jgi:hypothetical protein